MVADEGGTSGQLTPVACAGPVEVAPQGLRGRLRRTERGMVSAEWAVGIIAAIGIAGVLLAVVTSGPVEKAILRFILVVIDAFARGL